MKVLDEVKASGSSAFGYREWTVIGAMAKVIDELESGGRVLIGKVVDVTGHELPLPSIRMAISKIASDQGLNVFTRKKGEYLMIGLV